MSPQVMESQVVPRKPPSLVSIDGRTYPLLSAQIRSSAEGGLAQTTLVQEFDNPHDEPLEVIYTMPLPADGAVLGYVIRMGDRVIRGEIEVREKAEAAYKKALYEGKTAGLLEENRADTYQQRLGNLPARTKAEISIEVLHPLAFLLGAGERGPVWEYRFPTVVGVRYQGAPGRVKDAEKSEADRANSGEIPTRVMLDLRIGDAGEAAVHSPSHPIASLLGADATHVHLAEGAPLDRDLIVQWPATTAEVGVRVVEGAGLPGDEGRYALVTVTPPAVPATTFHRDLTILIDASGSMEGAPLDIAKQVVAALLKGLQEGDRFEVLAFASTVERLSPSMAAATPAAVTTALKALGQLQAGGSTEMESAIKEAMKSLRPDSQRQIVLLSDGYIGFEAEVLSTVARRPPAGVRIHAVGIGAAPNRTLTRGLARAGRGHELIVNDVAGAAEAAKRLCAATALPVLTDLAIGGSALLGFAPARPRDVFAGQPLVLAARLRPEGGSLELSGRLAGSPEMWGWRTNIAANGAAKPDDANVTSTSSTLPIGALFGRERIADLEAWTDTVDPRSSVDNAIEKLGLAHRIVSRRTSLVAISEDVTVDPLAPRRRERLAVEMPHGVSAEGAGLQFAAMRFRSSGLFQQDLAMPAMLSMPQAAGSDSIMRALNLRRGRSAVSATAVLLGIENNIATLEIEVPDDGFVLPTGRVVVIGEDGAIMEAAAETGTSSPEGPHKKGTLVRLALALNPADLAAWLPGMRVRVGWEVESRQGLFRSERVEYEVEVVIPTPKPEND